MKKLILISLVFLVASKVIEFGTETPYDSSNSEFTFSYTGNGAIFVYASGSTVNSLELKITAENTDGKTSINRPGEGLLISPNSGNNFKLKFLGVNSNDKGTIWVNPSTNVLPVDLNKKYEGKFPIGEEYGINAVYKLTYKIDNAEKDATFKFNYNNKIEIQGDDWTVSNPFEVCHGTDCQKNVVEYDFEKGQSYTIYVKMEKKVDTDLNREIYVLPPFSFADKNYKENASSDDDSMYLRSSLCLISLLLLLI